MSSGRHHKEWSTRGRIERAASADQLRAEHARALIAAAQARAAAAKPKVLMRPGVSVPTTLRYATTSEPQRWNDAVAAKVVVNAITDAAQDGSDRIVFPWPNRLGGSFVSAAIALQQSRVSGSLAYATFGYWPWRSGATWAARSVLVNPADLLTAARRICTEVRAGAAWATDSKMVAHEDRAVVELRLDELLKDDVQQASGRDAVDRVVVRSPNLLEATAVFPPGEAKNASYTADGDQVLYRVRRYTRIGKLTMASRLSTVGDPSRTPFALLGLMPALRPEELNPLLQHERVAQLGLDVVVVDLTQLSRQSVPDNWEKAFSALLSALGAAPGRRPPVAVIVEDAYALNIVSRLLRSHNASLVPRRPPPTEIGAYLPHRGTLGPIAELPRDLAPVLFEPDIKDAALAPIRKRLLVLGSGLREQAGATAADAASRALRFLRRAASLPVGLSEARGIADILHTEDDEIDRTERSAFRAKMELAPLYDVAVHVPTLGAEARSLAAEIERKVESWSDETPVSAKLTAMLNATGRRASGTMIAVASARIRDVFLSSERALNWDCDVVAPDDLAGRLAIARPERLVVIGPSPDIVRVLLTSSAVPARVALIGDAAGIGLLSSEIRPICRIEAFRPLAARAAALQAALASGGGDESLDLAEAEFRIRSILPEGEVDFTKSGGDYKGEVVHIRTDHSGRFAYRPSSDVLIHSASELRPFLRRDARDVHVGDFILALGNNLREKLRRALSGSRTIQETLATYHGYIAQVRPRLPGKTVAEKARGVLTIIQRADASVPDSEVHNVRRWITADIAECDSDGYRMPGAARDWRRFSLFAAAVGMPDILAKTYWQAVVLPTRAYRVQEGHGFNQQVVQFVLDPEGTAIGAGVFARMPDLWQLVLAAVDEVASITMENREGKSAHG